MNETILKAIVLTRGVRFTEDALEYAAQVGAKSQNLVYNAPAGASRSRPQELFLVGDDGYRTVVSCVSPVEGRTAVEVETGPDGLQARVDGHVATGVQLQFVKKPHYYDLTVGGVPLTRIVSACGHDELNIWPWHDCAISRLCRFCGINSVKAKLGQEDLLGARTVASAWPQVRDAFLAALVEGTRLALNDDCYARHLHVILISGNLPDADLDAQALICADMARVLLPLVRGRATEGIVAVTAPPHDPQLLSVMAESGIENVVFNLEVGNEPWFSKYCPGKARLGRDFLEERLVQATAVFGRGHAWTNFVLGLEPVGALLETCDRLARLGVNPGANVLHVDAGSVLDVEPPRLDETLAFYRGLAGILRRHELAPYYCQEALRTSIANEAFAGRI